MMKTNKKIMRVAFFGDAQAVKNQKHFEMAKKTANLLAKNGYIIANGGGPGVMLASTLGAKEVGGKVEVVVVKKENVPGNFEGRCEENLILADKVYEMANYENRLNKLVEIADAFVIFKGGTGTLAEVGIVWSKAKFDYGNHEPLIFVGEEWREIVPIITQKLRLETTEKRVYEIVSRPEEVWDKLAKVEN
jgi:uncharacterized protein (TIGR00725 family)